MYQANDSSKLFACTESLPPLRSVYAGSRREAFNSTHSAASPALVSLASNSVPAMFQLIIFYASEKFYKFYRHHHENCRRILTRNFTLIHIKAGMGSSQGRSVQTFLGYEKSKTISRARSHCHPKRRPKSTLTTSLISITGKQQHFCPITHSRLHQLHDFRFRSNICAHTAQEIRREMGAGIVDWATSNSPSRDKLHNDGCD